MNNVICLESVRRQRELETTVPSDEHLLVEVDTDMEYDSHVSFNAVTKEIIDLS